MKKRRVVITGIGAVTPVGDTFETTWNGIVEGVCVASPVDGFDASLFSTNISYEAKDFQFDKSLIQEDEAPCLNRAGQMGVTALMEALEQSKILEANNDPRKMSIHLGVGMGASSFDWYKNVPLSENFESDQVLDSMAEFPSMLTSVAARISGAKGRNTTVHTACASSGQSVSEAYDSVAYGDSDIAITGGADSMVTPLYFAGFSLLGALSARSDDPKTASRPFDADRNGFVLGEGACMLVLEEYDYAKKRGAEILGEICGNAITESAYRITDLHPEGRGPKEAMEMAVMDAGIKPEDVGYINAHGTSTRLNDQLESLAVSRTFPDCDVHVSSTKSMTGHLISAAGAIELAICTKALEKQLLPPSINLFNQDPDIKVKITNATATPKKMEYALSNSVGFGGSNTAIVVRRVSDEK